MTDGQSKLYKKLIDDSGQSQLLVSDVVQYLSRLARLHKEDKTGNLELSKGLISVAQALRPYARYPVLELTDAIKKRLPSARGVGAVSRKGTQILPSTLESIGQEDAERILDDAGYTKQQLAELGFRRFGISRSKLERLPKKDALNSIRAALEHEKSLDVISKEASKGGTSGSA